MSIAELKWISGVRRKNRMRNEYVTVRINIIYANKSYKIQT